MSRITLVPSDGVVIVDGDVQNGIDFSDMDPMIHAVQWYDTIGEIEYTTAVETGKKKPNEKFNDFPMRFKNYIDRHAAKKAEIEAEKAKKLADAQARIAANRGGHVIAE